VDGSAKQLSSTGMIVGVFAGAPYTAETVPVDPGSTLYIFSDGCYEVLMPSGEQMECPPFLKMLEECALSMQSLDSVVRDVQEIQQKPEFDDDFSLVEFRFF
jgi:sigma-B regulation protein RsbU (phosphoserine phosphatase)